MRVTPLDLAVLVGAPLVACGPTSTATEADAARAVCTVLGDLAGLGAEVAGIPTSDPESATYGRSRLVVEPEKPRSLVKPDAADVADPELATALTAEPSCRSSSGPDPPGSPPRRSDL